MLIGIGVVLILIAIGLLSGFKGSGDVNLFIGMNNFSTTTFELGISNRNEYLEDGKTVQVLTIGLFPFIIELEFFKTY